MHVIWLPRARDDLQAIEDYIAEDNPRAADLVTETILAASRTLREQPSAGRPGRVSGTRELVVPTTPYLIAYTAVERRILVLAVLHGARKWPESF